MPKGLGNSFGFHKGHGSADNYYDRANALMANEREYALNKTYKEMGIPVEGQSSIPSPKEQAFDNLISRLGLTDEQVRDILLGNVSSNQNPIPDITIVSNNPIPADIPSEILDKHLQFSSDIKPTNISKKSSSYDDVISRAKQLIEERDASEQTSETEVVKEEPSITGFVLSRSN